MHDGRRDVTGERPETNVKCDGNVKGNMDASGDTALGLDQWFQDPGKSHVRAKADSFILLTRSIRDRYPVFESLAGSRKCKHMVRC